MKTIELMSTEPRRVRAVDRLDAAANALWEGDCGLVPVVDGAGALVGVITDRDLCMAAYTQGRALDEIPVIAAMAREVTTCRADDSIADVMQTMQQRRVHRLPVVDAGGILVGVISTNDLIRAAHARPAAVEPAAVVRMLATIGSPRNQPIVAAPAPTPATAKVVTPTKKPAARKAAAAKPATRSTRPKRQAAKPASKARGRKKA